MRSEELRSSVIASRSSGTRDSNLEAMAVCLLDKVDGKMVIWQTVMALFDERMCQCEEPSSVITLANNRKGPSPNSAGAVLAMVC
jgi:hypothetical protein